ncbi:hypothetical protein [Cohnella sp. JJ-181]|nr:hypothetical protein [Cohnella sp. JJ-181]CAI6083412.1 hypothetical protein COHCIP112018_03985 [Cohnella sp. JJ-181]
MPRPSYSLATIANDVGTQALDPIVYEGSPRRVYYTDAQRLSSRL